MKNSIANKSRSKVANISSSEKKRIKGIKRINSPTDETQRRYSLAELQLYSNAYIDIIPQWPLQWMRNYTLLHVITEDILECFGRKIAYYSSLRIKGLVVEFY